MDISFKAKKMQKQCSNAKESVRKFGAVGGKRLQQRMMELKACSNLGELKCYPNARCHELKGNMKGKLSVDLEHPYRLILQPGEEHGLNSDGGIDWESVTKIIVIGVEDTHSGKEKR